MQIQISNISIDKLLKLPISTALFKLRQSVQKSVLVVKVITVWRGNLWPSSSPILPFLINSLFFSSFHIPAVWLMVSRWSSGQERLRWLSSLCHTSLSDLLSVLTHTLVYSYLDEFNELWRSNRPLEQVTWANMFWDGEHCLPTLSWKYERTELLWVPWWWQCLFRKVN